MYHISMGVPSQLRGDPSRLRQILTNLLSNAIKFTQRREVVLRVMFLGERADKVQLRFEVQDGALLKRHNLICLNRLPKLTIVLRSNTGVTV